MAPLQQLEWGVHPSSARSQGLARLEWLPGPLSPGDPILDVVEEALGHQWVLIQVDEVWCLQRDRRIIFPAEGQEPDAGCTPL